MSSTGSQVDFGMNSRLPMSEATTSAITVYSKSQLEQRKRCHKANGRRTCWSGEGTVNGDQHLFIVMQGPSNQQASVLRSPYNVARTPFDACARRAGSLLVRKYCSIQPICRRQRLLNTLPRVHAWNPSVPHTSARARV